MKLIGRFALVLIWLWVSGFLSCSRSDGAELVRAKIRAGALIVDVRTPAEFALGHYPGAVNIPLQELDRRLPELGPKKRPVVVYCRTGNRSGKAKAVLLREGFADVTNGGGLREMPPSEKK